MALALVCDLREHRVPTSTEELAGLETDVLAGVLAAPALTRNGALLPIFCGAGGDVVQAGGQGAAGCCR